jgi:two-component system response regulator GlrR
VPSLQVLIVDDDQMMAKTLADVLAYRGHRAITAHSAREALAHVESTTFDCVLSDIRMPEMNGLTLYQEMQRRHGEIPVVLMTAYSENQLVQESLRSGVIAVFTKPINLETLFQLLGYLPNQVDEFIRSTHRKTTSKVMTRLDLAQVENGSTRSRPR